MTIRELIAKTYEIDPCQVDEKFYAVHKNKPLDNNKSLE